MTINLLNKNHDQSDLNSGLDSAVTPVQSVSLFPDSADVDSRPEPLRSQFWSRFALNELNHSEWEALCDGCGSCCLIKYIDNDDDEELVEYTDVTCQLMDCSTGYCSHYATRQEYVPDCIQLTMENLPNMMWLPSHCAYKRLYKGQGLPSWHLLLTEDAVVTQQQMRAANVGVAGRCVTELGMSDEEMETRVINWVNP
ncbi:YcgN family cysteine cluster protein [Psychrobacter sp. AOP7-B1-25]|uniref:YcgN family cysteine cluster protein n=1 Tax=Psychrobacter sp. AOP7-B1-25 TaxID=3457644 RepID=UPI00402B77F0